MLNIYSVLETGQLGFLVVSLLTQVVSSILVGIPHIYSQKKLLGSEASSEHHKEPG